MYMPLRSLAAPADQIVSRDPVNQAFVTLAMERQYSIAIKLASGAWFELELIDLLTATQFDLNLLLGSIRETPLQLSLTVTRPGGPSCGWRRLGAGTCLLYTSPSPRDS